MANNSVLIVDDTPVNLKLVRVLLSRQGFDVRTANTAEEALEVVQSFQPRLVLADIQLPGMDGLEMTRRLKADPTTRRVIVLALTAFAMKGDEQKAFDAGCDGYITKPIDTRTFPLLIREYMNRSQTAANDAPPAPAAQNGVSQPALRDLQQGFLAEGVQQSGKLIGMIGVQFDPSQALIAAQHWAATATAVGYPQISQHARDLETLLRESEPASAMRMREVLTRLARLFAENLDKLAQGSAQPVETSIPAPPKNGSLPALTDGLAGKRFALIGFAPDEANRLSQDLTRLQAFSRSLDANTANSGAEGLHAYDMVLLNVAADMKSVPHWNKPMLLTGPREVLLQFEEPLRSKCEDFLFSPWSVDEAMLRSYLAVSRAAQGATEKPAAAARNHTARILVADDDSTTRTLVEANFQNSGFDSRVAGDASEVLSLIRDWRPDAVVLDVSKPSLNGFQVLSSLRNEPSSKGVRVILLTVPQQEQDVIRGFSLGADDYMIKPFSPMELIARLKRLLGNQA